MGIQIGVPKELASGERRVALVPDIAAALVKNGLKVAVESGAGVSAGYRMRPSQPPGPPS